MASAKLFGRTRCAEGSSGKARDGRKIDEHLIKPGTRIRLYYDYTSETRVINRVVVEDD